MRGYVGAKAPTHKSTIYVVQAFVHTILKPVAAIRYPPAQNTQWDCGHDSPPEWQSDVRRQTQYRPRRPEDLSLHAFILARLGTRHIALLQKDNTPTSFPAIRNMEPPSERSDAANSVLPGVPEGRNSAAHCGSGRKTVRA